MFLAGQLLYFDPFHFDNGNESKPKYFLVLKVIDNTAILASLPSSKKHLPQDQKIIHGCLDIPDSCINCYIFEATRPITKNGWSFPLDTLLYGNWIADFNVKELAVMYPLPGVDYDIVGELLDEELENIIECFSNSSTVKRRYRRILGYKC